MTLLRVQPASSPSSFRSIGLCLWILIVGIDSYRGAYAFLTPDQTPNILTVRTLRHQPIHAHGHHAFLSTPPPSPSSSSTSSSSLKMISTGEDRSEWNSLDISKTTYSSILKAPRDAYRAFAEKGASNAKMSKRKIFHQAVMGGSYVGFGAMVALEIAGNLQGLGLSNPGIPKMVYASLFPVNLLMILVTGGQLFTGNSATVSAAKYEGLVEWRELGRNFFWSLVGNFVGCTALAMAFTYTGILQGGSATLCTNLVQGKVYGASTTMLQKFVKGILCNWMVCLAVFLAGASNDLTGKLVGCWFPISTFVAIGLEHSIANMFLMASALCMGSIPGLSVWDCLLKNMLPVLAGNAVAGSFIVAGSYSYQFGALGKKSRDYFIQKLRLYELRKKKQKIARRFSLYNHKQYGNMDSSTNLPPRPTRKNKNNTKGVERQRTVCQSVLNCHVILDQ